MDDIIKADEEGGGGEFDTVYWIDRKDDRIAGWYLLDSTTTVLVASI